MSQIFSLLLLFSLSLILTCTASFDEASARRYFKFSIAAYCNEDKLANWSCEADVCQSGFSDIAIQHSSDRNAQSFTGYDSANNEIIVALRGTVPYSFIDWIIDDAEYALEQYAYDTEGAKVHHGFYHTFDQLKSQIEVDLRKLIQKHPNTPVTVTGHSLGAALSVLCALEIQQNIAPVARLYNFGLPRVGNPEFQEWYSQNGIRETYRVTHARDPIPHLPPKLFGYEHINEEIFFKGGLSDGFIVCKTTEDKECSDGLLLPVNILDHASYMGQDMLPAMMSCELEQDFQQFLKSLGINTDQLQLKSK